MRSATMLFTSCRRSVSRSQPFVLGKRFTSSNGAQKQAVSHGQLYSDLLPGMIPVALLGSAVYLVRPSFYFMAYSWSFVSHRPLYIIYSPNSFHSLSHPLPTNHPFRPRM